MTEKPARKWEPLTSRWQLRRRCSALRPGVASSSPRLRLGFVITTATRPSTKTASSFCLGSAGSTQGTKCRYTPGSSPRRSVRRPSWRASGSPSIAMSRPSGPLRSKNRSTQALREDSACQSHRPTRVCTSRKSPAACGRSPVWRRPSLRSWARPNEAA